MDVSFSTPWNMEWMFLSNESSWIKIHCISGFNSLDSIVLDLPTLSLCVADTTRFRLLELNWRRVGLITTSPSISPTLTAPESFQPEERTLSRSTEQMRIKKWLIEYCLVLEITNSLLLTCFPIFNTWYHTRDHRKCKNPGWIVIVFYSARSTWMTEMELLQC